MNLQTFFNETLVQTWNFFAETVGVEITLGAAITAFLSVSAVYYLIVNSFYLFLLALSAKAIHKQQANSILHSLVTEGQSPFLPAISVIVPAYNEEKTIVQSVQSFLSLQYPRHDIIVINDGSKDGTLEALIKAFNLVPTDLRLDMPVPTEGIIDVFTSQYHDNLMVINKFNGGKADSLNAGLAYARHDLVCSVDADSLLESDALLKVVGPFVEDPDRTVAVGGTVRVINDSKIRHGIVERIQLPKSWLGRMQVVEYTRSFLCGRTGWNSLNATLIISGAFGLFRRSVLLEVGAYKKGLGEDMELITRVHYTLRKEKRDYRIVFIPDPVCWTESPESLKFLSSQRDRWQRGLADSLLSHKSMFMNPRFGTVGMVAFPYMFIVELFGPILELTAYVLFFVGLSLGLVNTSMAIIFLSASFLYSVFISVVAISIDETFYGRYDRVRDYWRLILASAYESMGFRQLVGIWRIKGLIKYFRKDDKWGQMLRTGYTSKHLENKPGPVGALHRPITPLSHTGDKSANDKTG